MNLEYLHCNEDLFYDPSKIVRFTIRLRLYTHVMIRQYKYILLQGIIAMN